MKDMKYILEMVFVNALYGKSNFYLGILSPFLWLKHFRIPVCTDTLWKNCPYRGLLESGAWWQCQCVCVSFGLLSVCVYAESLQSCPTLCDPIVCSPPGSSVRGILQARILAWVAMPSSRGSSQPRDQTQVSCPLHWQAVSLPLVPPRNPRSKQNYMNFFQEDSIVQS